jgi:hypothetical protein
MPATYEPIATTTLGSAAATITFSSISSAYTDLRIVLVGSSSSASEDDPQLRFNSDSGTNYSRTQMRGDGTSASSNRQTSQNYMVIGKITATGSIKGMTTADIFSYAGSTYKTVLGTGSADANGSGNVQRAVGLWRSTAAITSIQIALASSSNFEIGTTATLYGILKA